MSATTTQAPLVDPVRIHISPLDPELFKLLLPPSKLPSFSNLSYHHLETLPERSYAFLDVSSTHVDVLRKQLDGAIIRGKKIRVNRARIEDWKNQTPDEPELAIETPGPRLGKEEPGVLAAVELSDGRKIQRGWTKPMSKSKEVDKKYSKSKFTDKPECLFKTTLPPNVSLKGLPAAAKKHSKRQSNKTGRVVTLHEFSQSTQYPSFLRSETSQTSTGLTKEYVDGVGWVDDKGNVIEPARPVRARPVPQTIRKPQTEKTVLPVREDTANLPAVPVASSKTTAPKLQTRSEESRLDSEISDSSSESSGAEANSEEDDDQEAAASSSESGTDTESVASSSKSASGSPSRKHIEPPSELHPLEAVFKPQALPRQVANVEPANVDAPFTFFAEDEEEDEEPESIAVAKRAESSSADSESGISSDDDEEMEDAPSAEIEADEFHETTTNNDPFEIPKIDPMTIMQTVAQSVGLDLDEIHKNRKPFSEEFYETRGATNRAWKKRRREAHKEQRKRDNKRREKRLL
jgi:hypothetical protein